MALEFRLDRTIGTNRTEQRLVGRQKQKGVALVLGLERALREGGKSVWY